MGNVDVIMFCLLVDPLFKCVSDRKVSRREPTPSRILVKPNSAMYEIVLLTHSYDTERGLIDNPERDIVGEEYSFPDSSGSMLSEYELLNITSSKRYTRVCSQSAIVNGTSSSAPLISGPVHIINEEDMVERNYTRPPAIRNGFDLFM